MLEVAPNAEVLLITADVSDEKAVENYINKTVEKFKKIDGGQSYKY